MRRRTQLQKDLVYVFYSFPLDCLYHLRDNRHRLIRSKYCDEQGNGCLMYLLSEPLPGEQRIRSKTTLINYFSDGDPDAVAYQPAKWLVRIWDERICSVVKRRYGEGQKLTADQIMEVLDEVIEERESHAASSVAEEQFEDAGELVLV